ncbi:MAG: glycerophosphoryl diester phosphodiesterase membrane domain-containing protein, partial [Pseudomonadales bacterium]|nr:glycerophosphoryl diester phosphodiesterase membrane domain-containing protein [Pseudomonadales bacterium]
FGIVAPDLVIGTTLPGDPDQTVVDLENFFPLVLLLVILATLPFVLFFGLGVIAQANATRRGVQLAWHDAAGVAFRRFPSALLCLLIYFVVFGGIFFVAVIVWGVALATIIPAIEPSIVFGLLFGFGLVIGLLVYWCFALPLVVTENLGAVKALGRSWTLVRGHWWRTLLILTSATFIVLVVTVVLSVVGYLLATLAAGTGSVGGMSVILFGVDTLGGTVTTPLFVAVLLATLHDLTLRRGGDDLQERLEAIGGRDR